MDNERIRALCMAMQGVAETVSWGHHLVYWAGDRAIGGKMFALTHLDGVGTGVAWFHAGPERYYELLETEGVIPAPYMARAHWVAVERWDVFRPREWEELLAHAYELVRAKLPKKTQELLALPEKERKLRIRERAKPEPRKAAPAKSGKAKSGSAKSGKAKAKKSAAMPARKSATKRAKKRTV